MKIVFLLISCLVYASAVRASEMTEDEGKTFCSFFPFLAPLPAVSLPKVLKVNGHTIGFYPQTQNLELHTKYIVPCERTVEEVSFEWSHPRILSTESKVRTTY